MKLGEALCQWLLGNQQYLDLKVVTMSMIIEMMKDQINSAALICNYKAVKTHLGTLRIRLDAVESKEPGAYEACIKKIDPLITFFDCDVSRDLNDITDAELERWASLEVDGAQDVLDRRAAEATPSVDMVAVLSKLLEGDLDDMRAVQSVVRDPTSKSTIRLFAVATSISPTCYELQYAMMDLGYDTSKPENKTGVSQLDKDGSYSWYDEKLLLNRIRKYAETKDEKTMDWRLFADNFEASHEYDLCSYDYRTGDREKVVDQLAKGELVSMAVGWSLKEPRPSAHVFMLSLFSLNGVVYLAHCNRGSGSTSDASIRLFKVNNPTALSTDDLYLKINAVKTTSRQYLLDVDSSGEGIGKDLGLEALPNIPMKWQWKKQKVGKCAMEVGKMKARMALAHQTLLANILKPINGSRLSKGEGVPFDMFVEALAESTPAYKHFRDFDRSESMTVIIDRLLNATEPDEIPLTAGQRLVVFDKFIDFVDLEHGCDDSAASKRIAIFKPLDDYLQSEQGRERLSDTPYYDKFCVLTKAALVGTEAGRPVSSSELRK